MQTFERLEIRKFWVESMRMDIWGWTQSVKVFESYVNIHQKNSTMKKPLYNWVDNKQTPTNKQKHQQKNRTQNKRKQNLSFDVSQHCSVGNPMMTTETHTLNVQGGRHKGYDLAQQHGRTFIKSDLDSTYSWVSTCL